MEEGGEVVGGKQRGCLGHYRYRRPLREQVQGSLERLNVKADRGGIDRAALTSALGVYLRTARHLSLWR